MTQIQFQARHEPEWQAFEVQLKQLSQRRRGGGRKLADVAEPWSAFPPAFRRLCQHYALAERRGYSESLLQRLHALVQRGHAALYRPAAPRWQRCLSFLAADFPRLVRAQGRYVALSAGLFFLPLLATIALLQWRPELIHTLFDGEQLAQFEAMYDPAATHTRIGRESGSDLQMFGFYIFNNVSIGFRTFASGLLGTVGAVFILLMNGVVIGAVAGHLTAIGYGGPFWRFVCGHSAPELLAIVIAGAAGLHIGWALLAPGRRSRARALLESGAIGARLCLGVFAMLVFAAFVEAFWSSIGWMPAAIKFAVGAALWLLIGLWLWRGGRGA